MYDQSVLLFYLKKASKLKRMLVHGDNTEHFYCKLFIKITLILYWRGKDLFAITQWFINDNAPVLASVINNDYSLPLKILRNSMYILTFILLYPVDLYNVIEWNYIYLRYSHFSQKMKEIPPQVKISLKKRLFLILDYMIKVRLFKKDLSYR